MLKNAKKRQEVLENVEKCLKMVKNIRKYKKVQCIK